MKQIAAPGGHIMREKHTKLYHRQLYDCSAHSLSCRRIDQKWQVSATADKKGTKWDNWGAWNGF